MTVERVGSFQVAGHALRYTDFGAGDRLVVLTHGQLMTRRMQAPLARALADDGYRVVTLDLLGHGESDRPTASSEYSMTIWATQVVIEYSDDAVGRSDSPWPSRSRVTTR